MSALKPVPVGARFGKLLVVATAGARARVKCDCGVDTVVQGKHLLSGNTRTCGCSRRTHGMYGSPTHVVWHGMVRRCHTPTSTGYAQYGGRGITVCARWRKFENFLADMGERPAGKTLDRIDSTKGYEPGNCRWATRKEQQRHITTNRLLERNGEVLPMVVWAERLGLPYRSLAGYVRRNGCLPNVDQDYPR